jgi:hypothetical protein
MTDGTGVRPDPYLSIVLTGRNDNFGGDFTERFLRALRFNHRVLSAAGIAHEFVLVEWRPLPEKPFLATVVEEACPGMVPAHLVSFVVDPEYHEAFSLNPRVAFQEFIAKNVGVRRSRGRFVLTTNTDIYIGRELLQIFAAGTLRDGVLYRCVRVDLKNGLDVREVTWDVLEDPRNVEVANAIRPPCYTNASGDFLLLDRATYHALGGFNEVYRAAKIHIDGNFCVKAHGSGVRVEPLDAHVYHVGLGTLYANHPKYQARPDLAPWGDIRWRSDVVYDNHPAWGLAEAPTRQVTAGIHYLDFDWKAVPPMLDLRRLVLPASRLGFADL